MSDPNRDILDDMAGPLFEHPSGSKGRFIVKPDGSVVPESSIKLPDPIKLLLPAPIVAASPVMGRTRVGEYLMIDIRIAKAIPKGSKLFKICQKLARAKACGVVESTLVIDLLRAHDADGRFLLCPTNWPKPDDPEVEHGEE